MVQVIYIGGPSSSGKSLLSKELQLSLTAPFLHLSLDKVIGMMPAKLNDWEGGHALEGFSWRESKDREGHLLQELEMGPFAHQVCDLFIEMVVFVVGRRFSVIVDDVPLSRADLDRWKEALQGVPTLYVGLAAPIEVLESRERAREGRIVGSARAQAYACAIDFGYDLTFDTSCLSLAEQVKQISACIE